MGTTGDLARYVVETKADQIPAAIIHEGKRCLINFLSGFRFSGDVDAPPEGTVVFADEPLIRVTAPIAEAQLVETRIINFLHFQINGRIDLQSLGIQCIGPISFFKMAPHMLGIKGDFFDVQVAPRFDI